SALLPPVLSSHHPAPPEPSTLSLHDALPIWDRRRSPPRPASAVRAPATCGGAARRRAARASAGWRGPAPAPACDRRRGCSHRARSEEHTSELQSRENLVCRLLLEKKKDKREA